MAPTGNRSTTNKRCQDGWDLRRRGRTWREVADELKFSSENTARKAVMKWLWKNPPDDLETMRRATGDTLVETTVKLANAIPDAIDAGKYRDAAELGKVVIDGLDKHAKLTGQHIVVPKETNVNVQVQTASEVMGELRTRLMAAIDAEVPALGAAPASGEPPIDAEVVEVVEA